MIKIGTDSIRNLFGRNDDDEFVDIDKNPGTKPTKPGREKREHDKVKSEKTEAKPRVKLPNIGGALKDLTNPYSDTRLGIKSAKMEAARKAKTAALKTSIGARGIVDRFRKDRQVEEEVKRGRKSRKNKKK